MGAPVIPHENLKKRWENWLSNFGPLTEEGAWVFTYLLFLGFMFFQNFLSKGKVDGYWVFWFHPIETLHPYWVKTLMAGFLFFGPLLLFFKRPLRLLLLFIFCLSMLYFHGVVFSADPAYQSGGDRAEALNLGVQYLSHGTHPYLKTPGHQPTTPLSSNFLLAAPFYLVFQRSELANLPLMVGVFFLLAWWRKQCHSWLPLEALMVLTFIYPPVLWELLWASDSHWGGILLTASLVLLAVGKYKWSAAFFAFALCTRTSFWFLGPLWAVYLLRKEKVGRLWPALGVFAAIFLALELPLLLWAPDTFLHYAPIGHSRFLMTHGAPYGENLIGDIMNLIFPPGNQRPFQLTLFNLAASLALGLWVKNLWQLAYASITLCTFMVAFMGYYFLLDYINWAYFPMVWIIMAGRTEGEKPLAIPSPSQPITQQ